MALPVSPFLRQNERRVWRGSLLPSFGSQGFGQRGLAAESAARPGSESGPGVLRAASPAVEPGVGFDRSGREPCRRLESFILILTRSLRWLLPQKAGLTFLRACAPLVTATRDLGQAT